MKKLFFIAVFSLLINSLGFSQADDKGLTPPEPELKPLILSIGPFLSVKAGVNTATTVNGRQNQIAFNSLPDMGVSALWLFNIKSNLGLLFDLGVTTHSFGINQFSGDKKFTEKFTYFSLAPEFYFSGFLLGFGFGIPMSASYGSDIGTDKLNTMAEFRLGYHVKLVQTELGTFNFFVRGYYVLNGMFKDFVKDDPLNNAAGIPPADNYKITDQNNPRAASLSLGLSFLFGIKSVK